MSKQQTYQEEELLQIAEKAGERFLQRLVEWNRAYQGDWTVPELATDRPRSSSVDYTPEQHAFVWDDRIGKRLSALAERFGVTIDRILLAIWQVMLVRYTGQEQILIGLWRGAGEGTDSEPFAEMMFVIAEVSRTQIFSERLTEQLRAELEAVKGFGVPTVDAVRPVNEKVPATERFPVGACFAANDSAGREALAIAPMLAYDVCLSCTRDGGVITYNAALFDQATIERMVDHLQVLAADVVEEPEQEIGQLALLSEAEWRLLIDEWSGSQSAYPQDKTVAALFAQQAAARPNEVAVVFRDRRLTYGELNEHANQVAHELLTRGVVRGQTVGLCMERAPEMVVGLLGILKAGAAYVPLDPQYPADRLRYMIVDSGVKLILTQTHLQQDLQEHDATLIALDGEEESAGIARHSTAEPKLDVDAEDLAYLIYTSGSTGRPKGVCVTQQNIVRLVKNTDYATLTSEQVLMQVAPISFDAATFELWGSLLNGARLVLYPQPKLSLEELGRVVEAQGVTILWLTTGLFHLLAEGDMRHYRGLRHILTGGDVMSPSKLEHALRMLPGVRISNMYGPTENTTFTTAYPMESFADSRTPVPIGRPIANTQVYVLDAAQQPVPIGVPGELYVGGAGVAQGYWERHELTAERFVTHPFSGEPGAKLYRTGDRVRFLADGSLEFLSRLDQQVKIRGYRIELGEVEAALTRHPQVGEAAVTVQTDATGDKCLVAYVVQDAEAETDETFDAVFEHQDVVNESVGEKAETTDSLTTAPFSNYANIPLQALAVDTFIPVLRRYLSERLPDYMMPAAFVVLDRLPLTANGKVDRKSLPTPTWSRAGVSADYVAPRTELETEVTAVFARMLGCETVGLHDNFFELGGHSLIATRVLSRLRERYGIELPMRDFFAASTVAGVAEQIAARQGSATEYLPMERVDREGDLPLSFGQQRLWFLQRLLPENQAYHIPVPLRLRGPLDRAALAYSLQRIVERHEVLRTVFVEKEGLPKQVILDPTDFALPVQDLQHLPFSEREREVVRLMQAEFAQGFDLTRGPLFRAVLLRLNAEEHVLFMRIHHIVADGWSLGVLIDELVALYEAKATHGKSFATALPDLPVQYADFAQWQRQHLQGDLIAEQLAYWTQQLGGTLPVLQLPTDRPKPSVQTYRGAVYKQALPQALIEQLQSLSHQEGVTLFMTLLTTFQILLHRYSGQDDLVIGTPLAGRTRSEVEGLIGFFVNTLVLRTDLSGHPTFRELLRRVRDVALGAQAHQDLPFEQLVNALQPDRELTASPLFQVTFAVNNAPLASQTASELLVTPLEFDPGTAIFDLSLSCEAEATGQWMARWEYNTDLWDEETVERMMAHWQQLLTGAVANPQQTIDRLPLLREEDSRNLLTAWSGATNTYADEELFVTAFEQQVARDPEQTAVLFGKEGLSYEQLNRRANQLAHHLKRRGIGAEKRVGVALERSTDLVVALLGILKAGAAYVPLDPAYPAERLQYMIEDAGLSLILTQEGLLSEKLPEKRLGLTASDDAEAANPLSLCLRQDGSKIALETDDNPNLPIAPDQLAYIIYTSGSTGQPKGVMIEHRGICNLTANQGYAWEIEASSRVLQFASINFDASLMEMFNTLYRGATLVLPTPEAAMPGQALVELLREGRVTHLMISPSALSALPDADLPALRTIIAGGEACSSELVARWGTGRRFFNAYGPTEVTVCATMAELTATDQKVSIGRPLANTEVYLLDEHLQPVALGVPGELHVGGVGLARGYVNRPDLSAERFIAHPLQAGKRLYKTGDLARFLPDGRLEYLGRIDQQVKVRGFRIELGEIEQALLDHPAVRESVVAVHLDETGDKRLVAYIVPSTDGTSPAARDLQEFARKKLPHFMVPSAILTLDALPLTPNGKLDRQGLPTPDWGVREEATSYVPPRNDLEATMAQIWQETLGVERIGVHDNFFDLGGHSLLATQVLSRVRERFQVELPLRLFFETPTVAEFVVRLEADLRNRGAGGIAPARELPPILPIPRREGEEIPLSFAQQRLWFLDQLEPQSALYNMVDVISLQGELHRTALARALNSVVERHEALRTVFIERDGQPRQKILPFAPFALPVQDLSDLPEQDREKAALEAAKREAKRPFDLTSERLIRFHLMRLAEEDFRLLITTHHIVSDGWSHGVLFEELAALYRAHLAGDSAPLPPLPIQYADFTVWQREIMQGDVLAEQVAFWKRHLSGELPLLELPTDRARPAKPSNRGAYHKIALSPQLSARVKELSQREGATLFMTLKAAFDALLYRYTGQDDMLVGSAIANRNRREIEGLIGFFVNMLALRVDLSGNPTFRDLIARVRDIAFGAFAHQDLPFEKLVEEVQPERDLTQSPLFRVVFVLQNAPMEQVELPGLTLRHDLEIDNETAKFDLTLSLMEGEEGLSGIWEYDCDLFDRETIERLSLHFGTLLESAVQDPSRRLSELTLLSETEQRHLLTDWKGKRVDFPAHLCAHQFFEEQVKRRPQAVAVKLGEEHLTYAELDARANRLARHLQTFGVGPETLVGICLHRSPEMIVAVYGVLKAGGAYVPIDPTYPSERIAYMVNDSQLAVLLTSEGVRETLPMHLFDERSHDQEGAEVHYVLLDSDRARIDEESELPLPVQASPESPAYVIYTSGSTGRPKGVLLEHRGLTNMICALQDAFHITDQSRLLQFASFSFDAATQDIFTVLSAGGTLVLAPQEALLPGQGLEDLLHKERITNVLLPPSVLALITPEDLPDLQTVVSGGEACSAEVATRWANHCRFVNAYGPTEGTVVATCDTYVPGTGKPLIGRPIANVEVYVLDAERQPVPVGVPGELHIGGAGLARGYLHREELTAAKFIPHPFAAEEGARLYATGDLVRYLPDGRLDYLGRIDHQVKLRGFRIELGEIEEVLRQHPNVQEAVLLAREDEPGDKRLVAYVVPIGDVEAVDVDEDEAWEAEQVSQWEVLFDDIYNPDNAASDDETFNTVGWDSHYTGEPIPADEMREWLDNTIDRILSGRTDRVLEIGCGTGMILYRLLPHVDAYSGMDISGGVVEALRRQLAKQPEAAAKVNLLHRQADDFSDIAEDAFDTVVLNSVIQYFPSVEYLLEVLQHAVRCVAPGGSIFVGDVRSLPLLETFHTDVELFQAEDDLDVETFHSRVQARIGKDNELLMNPAFFYALQEHLPQVQDVQVLIKKGRGHNELIEFRYDVILHVGEPVQEVNTADLSIVRLDSQDDGSSYEAVRDLLEKGEMDAAVIRRVPDARIQHAVRATEMLAQVGQAKGGERQVSEHVPHTVRQLHNLLDGDSIACEGNDSNFLQAASMRLDNESDVSRVGFMQPDDFWRLQDEFDVTVELTPSSEAGDGLFDVLLIRNRPSDGGGSGNGNGTYTTRELQRTLRRENALYRQATERPPHPWHRYGSNPMQERSARHVAQACRRYLEERLPDYMVPSAILTLDRLPLTANGKVDRKALPAPDKDRQGAAADYLAPRDEVEELIADVWQEVLGVERVGVHDNFFELGGHSLLATRVISRLREAFEIDLPMNRLFEAQTVAALAQVVEEIIFAEIEALSDDEATDLLDDDPDA
ncbi:MAG TPA: amino acid adenylation domain-containing protein [Bacilli bacterium]|nr:amino acid adenylation domain-containing protein [Bacilli bacterium]